MSKRSLLEEKHRLLREMLHENLNKKHAMEISIRQQLEELKTLEIRLEKMQVAPDECVHSNGLRQARIAEKEISELKGDKAFGMLSVNTSRG